MRFKKSKNEENPFWISISDLMSGLLMLFILLTAFAFYQIVDLNQAQRAVFSLLEERMKKVGINPFIDGKTGTISIVDTILFEDDRAYLKNTGKVFLSKLVPIFSEVIFFNEEISREIVSIDIEGYATSMDPGGLPSLNAMQLSIERSLSVWEYILDAKSVSHHSEFLKKIRVCGWGNVLSRSITGIAEERKVVFKFQFKGIVEKIKANFEKKLGS